MKSSKRSPYLKALECLRVDSERLAQALTQDERRDLLSRISESIDLLQVDPHHVDTRRLAARVFELTRALKDRSPGDRATIIRERLGLSRSRYYELLAAGKESAKVRTRA